MSVTSPLNMVKPSRMKKVKSWNNTSKTKSYENRKFNNNTEMLTVRVPPRMKDQLKLLSMRSHREVSVYLRYWITQGLKKESEKEKIGLWPLERRLSP